MTTSMQKYTFDSPSATTYAPQGSGNKKKHPHHRRLSSRDSDHINAGDHDTVDGSGSLTYSAASSINSQAGESTDSSFADIMRVLDVQDSKELVAVLQKERARHSNSHYGTNKHNNRYRGGGDERSIAAHSIAAESLTYSTDAESHMRSLATDAEFSGLHGTGLLSTIAGYVSFRLFVRLEVYVCLLDCFIFLLTNVFFSIKFIIAMCHAVRLFIVACCTLL